VIGDNWVKLVVALGATKAWAEEAKIAKKRIAKSLEVNGIVGKYCELGL
jgi:Na+/H+ antiporter NhaC